MTSETVAGGVSYDYTGRVALIAGGSRGIGAAAARAFAAAGASVVIGARNLDAVRTVADEINATGAAAVAVRTDVTDPESSAALVQTAVGEFGRLDFAVNNATDGPMPAPMAEIDVDEFDLGLATNVRGTFLGMKYQIPAMLVSGGGAIVNMASGAGLTGTAGLGAYVAGKAGIIGLTKVAALDYADQGVRVNVVAPGPIRTEHIIAAGERAQQLAAAAVPMRRIGETEDVCQVVLWLCSQSAGFVTGATVPVDGGQSAGSKPERMYRPGESMD